MFQVNRPARAPPKEECYSDIAHARLLSSRMKLHDGVWLVDDNIRVHDTVMVKLSVRTFSCLSLSIATLQISA